MKVVGPMNLVIRLILAQDLMFDLSELGYVGSLSIYLHFDCCEKLSIKFDLTTLLLDMKFKHIGSHLKDLKYARFEISELAKEIKE
jgi:hypothetical protein